MGIGHVEASPLTRSSYHARAAADTARAAGTVRGADTARSATGSSPAGSVVP
jgi:hypothetical protein